MSFRGHIYSQEGPERVCLTGRLSVRRDRGRQRLTLKSASVWAEENMSDFLSAAESRDGWGIMIADEEDCF